MVKGLNGIGVTLASGWWSEASTFVVRNFNYFGDKESLLAKLVLTYEDGERQVVVSDTEHWKYYGEGPYTFAGFFAGENYDARRAEIYERYSEAAFDDRDWKMPVEAAPEPIDEFRSMPPGFGRSFPAVNQNKEIMLTGGYHAPVRIVGEACAKTMAEPEPGVYIYDLQQEMAGVPRIAFHEKRGMKVTVRFAEVLYPDLPEYAGNTGRLMRENYRDAASVDTYLCSGRDGEIYQPRFTFHGYRYIELTGVENPPAPEETDLQLMWNAFYYREAVLMGRFAGILHKEEDASHYDRLARQVKGYWNSTFVDPATKKTRTADGALCDTQCSYVLGLEYGVAAEEIREDFGRHLVRKARALDYTVGTGFFGTGLLNQALTDTGHTEEGYKNLLQTACPSWLYPVTQGATTIWERWDSYTEEKGFGGQNAMNSFNHYSLGSVLSWMYHVALGIRKDEGCPGGQRFILKPEIGPLVFAKGSVSSPYGVIRAGWERSGEQVTYRFEIPVNTRACLVLPEREEQEYGSGCYEVTYRI